MKDLGNDKFSISAGERIKIRTQVDKPPFDANFQDPPNGGAWQNIVPINLGEERKFVAPANGAFSFNVDFDEDIANDDPDPVAHYRTTFVSLTNPGDPPSTTETNVRQGVGPIPRFFTFTVV